MDTNGLKRVFINYFNIRYSTENCSWLWELSFYSSQFQKCFSSTPLFFIENNLFHIIYSNQFPFSHLLPYLSCLPTLPTPWSLSLENKQAKTNNQTKNNKEGSALKWGLCPQWDPMRENQFFLASWCQIEKVSWLEMGGHVHFSFSVLELGLAWTSAGPVHAATVPASSCLL